MFYSMSPVEPRVSARPAAGPPKPPRNKWARCPQESAAVQNRTRRHWLYTSLWFSRWQEWGLPTGVGIAWPPHACKEYPRWETLGDSRFIRSLLKKKKIQIPVVKILDYAGRHFYLRLNECASCVLSQAFSWRVDEGVNNTTRTWPASWMDISNWWNRFVIWKPTGHIKTYWSFYFRRQVFLWLLSGWRMGWFYQPMLCRGFKAQFLGNRLLF